VELSTGGRPDLFGGSGRPPMDNSLSFLIYKVGKHSKSVDNPAVNMGN